MSFQKSPKPWGSISQISLLTKSLRSGTCSIIFHSQILRSLYQAYQSFVEENIKRGKQEITENKQKHIKKRILLESQFKHSCLIGFEPTLDNSFSVPLLKKPQGSIPKHITVHFFAVQELINKPQRAKNKAIIHPGIRLRENISW